MLVHQKVSGLIFYHKRRAIKWQGRGHLHDAKKAKDDEFYTLFESIEIELKRYRAFFQGKIIYLPCDNLSSNFWLYFSLNFKFFGLKELIATSYSSSEKVFKYTLKAYGEEPVKEQLLGCGDFRSDESKALMDYCDIIITNPPFSLFREFVSQCVESKKDYIVVGSLMPVKYVGVYPLLRDKKLHFGATNFNDFLRPDGSIKKAPAYWYSTFNINKNHPLLCYKEYNEEEFPKYANYDAINVDRFSEIPKDYKGKIGVPISAFLKLNREQFDVIDMLKGGICKSFTKECRYVKVDSFGRFELKNEKKQYRRIQDPLLLWNASMRQKRSFLDEETGEYYASLFTRLIIKRNPNFKGEQ